VSPRAAADRDASIATARVALLTNFIAPYRLPLFRLLGERLGRLRVFISTPMEPNRFWRPDWGGLDVTLLPTLTLRRSARHPHAFREPLFVHLPYTAFFALWRFRPDVVVSGQLGLASALTALYCSVRRRTGFALWLTLSEVSEAGRGPLRRGLRRRLLARADAVMVNGESGARYVRSFGVPESKVFRVYQAIDVERFATAADRDAGARDGLLFVGSGEPRKGLRGLLTQLARWAAAHPDRSVSLRIAGADATCLGSERPDLPDNLTLHWLGPVPYERMPELYAEAAVLAFPTLADEWGLVVNEALAAGLPVLGSRYSQAVEELVADGETGWTFRPDRADEFAAALDRALTAPRDELARAAARARRRGAEIDFDSVATRMLEAIRSARERRA